MPNYVLFYATSPDEIYQCSYSLLKYLDVYNMKPPADHSVVVYSDDPARLEAYGPFFNSFEMKGIKNAEGGGRNVEVKDIFDQYKGNILYLPPIAYPVKELESLFVDISKGAAYIGQVPANGQANPTQQHLLLLAFNNKEQDLDFILRSSRTKNAGEFIGQYEDLNEFRQLLGDFFKRYHEESVPNQVKLMHSIDARQIQDQKNNFKRLPFLTKLLRKIMGKAWSISSYRSKI